MRFWIREIGGWLLIAIGLYVFSVCLSILLPPAPNRPKVFESILLVVIGLIIFRGGIHLLKVAVAARICTRLPPLPPTEEGSSARSPLPSSQQVTRLSPR